MMRTAWALDEPSAPTRSVSWQDGSCSSWPGNRGTLTAPMMRRATDDGLQLYGRPAPPSVASLNAHGSRSMDLSASADSLLRNSGSPSYASTSSLHSLCSLRSPGQEEAESTGSEATEPSTSAPASVSSEDNRTLPAYSLLSHLASLGSNEFKGGPKSDPQADQLRLDALADTLDRFTAPTQSDERTMARSALSFVHRMPLTTARSDWRDWEASYGYDYQTANVPTYFPLWSTGFVAVFALLIPNHFQLRRSSRSHSVLPSCSIQRILWCTSNTTTCFVTCLSIRLSMIPFVFFAFYLSRWTTLDPARPSWTLLSSGSTLPPCSPYPDLPLPLDFSTLRTSFSLPSSIDWPLVLWLPLPFSVFCCCIRTTNSAFISFSLDVPCELVHTS